MKVVKFTQEETNSINTGMDKKSRKAVAEVLSVALASVYSLYLKTQFYHWNVTGPHFAELHAMFEEQYVALRNSVDEIAERIRALGYTSPGTFREFTELSSVSEDKTLPGSWQSMVKNLTQGHEAIARNLREAIPAVQKAGDEATADLFIGKLQEHEKTAWMLRSLLGK